MRKRPRLEQDVTDTDARSTDISFSHNPLAASQYPHSEDSEGITGSTSEELSAGLKLTSTTGITLNLRDPPTTTVSSQQESIADTEAASSEMTASQNLQESDDEELPAFESLRDASMSPKIVLVGEESDGETVESDYEGVEVLDEEMGDDPVIDLEEAMARFPSAQDGSLVEAVRRFTKLIGDGMFVLCHFSCSPN
jgi:hypothetical protein